jgi:hypothetical protein
LELLCSRPTWGVAKTQINDARKQGLRVVPLALDELCELHAARELCSNALQGNINYDAAEALQWLKTHVEPWFNRYSQSAVEESHSKGPPPVARTRNNRGAIWPRPPTDLTEAQLGTVRECVRQRKLVDIKEVVRTLGDESLTPAVLRAVVPSVSGHCRARGA